MSDPIRVLIVIKGLGPGGAERLVVDQLKHGSEGIEYELFVCKERVPNLLREVEELGLPIHLGYRGRSWLLSLRRIIAAGNFNAVHAHLPIAAVGARLAVRTVRPRPKMIYTEHNRWPSYLLPTRMANWATIGLDDHDIAVSADAAASMRWPATKVEVVTHGIDLDSLPSDISACRANLRMELDLPNSAHIIGTVANLRREKAQAHLLAAFAAADLADTTLVLVGQGPLEADLKAEADKLGLGNRVRFLGYRSDATTVMAGFDVFTLPSAHEGRPVALMEAMSLGLPVLVSDAGGMPDMVEDRVNGTVVPVGDVKALSAALAAAGTTPHDGQGWHKTFDGATAFDAITEHYQA